MGWAGRGQNKSLNTADQLAWHERRWKNELEAALYVHMNHLYISIQISC